jgi:hypothetical protein
MIINGKVNGVELPVEIDNEVINQIRSDAVDSFIRNLITVKSNYIAERKEPLTEEEFDELVEFVTEKSASVWDYLADEIITGKFAHIVEEEYDRILDSRVKFYRVKGEVTIPVSFVVKAHDEDEALQFVSDSCASDFDDDCLQWYDAEIHTDCIEDVTDEGYYDSDPRIFDATY